MEKLYKKSVNCETGEESVTEYTAEEYKEHENWMKQIEDAKAMEKNRQEKRNSALAKLAALGLTEDEISALL